MLRPRSILQLVLIGFCIVTLPLILAFVGTALLVSDLSHTGQRSILRAAKVVEESRLLLEEANAMERNGRQYLVLKDSRVLGVYQQRRAQLHEAISGLRQLNLTDRQRLLLSDLGALDEGLFRRLDGLRGGDSPTALDPQELSQLVTLARGVLDESGRLINKNIETLGDSAQWVQSLLMWESVALVPAAILLGGVFVLLIVRPLRRLESAINVLGSGDFGKPVAIQGPLDLEQLGTRLEWMRQRLVQLEDHKALFLRNMSHELKTPLATLREGTQLLKEEIVGPLKDDQREVVTLVHQNTLRLQTMIEDLLSFSNSEATLLNRADQPVSLADLLWEVLEEQRLPIGAKRIDVSASLAPVMVRGDPMTLKAAVGNLISNAIKFSPSDSEVHIDLRKDADWANLEVRDFGSGIGESEREQVFEPFVQGQAQHDCYVKGSGLGLFIAREFIRLHGGTIDVLDCTQGALLQLRLPAAYGETGVGAPQLCSRDREPCYRHPVSLRQPEANVSPGDADVADRGLELRCDASDPTLRQ